MSSLNVTFPSKHDNKHFIGGAGVTYSTPHAHTFCFHSLCYYLMRTVWLPCLSTVLALESITWKLLSLFWFMCLELCVRNNYFYLYFDLRLNAQGWLSPFLLLKCPFSLVLFYVWLNFQIFDRFRANLCTPVLRR